MHTIIEWIRNIGLILDAILVCRYIWIEDYPGAIFWLLMAVGMVLLKYYDRRD